MILSFGDKQTENLWIDEKSKRYGNIARVALRKLLQLHAAEKFDRENPESIVGNAIEDNDQPNSSW